jgi:dTDP-4-amino-4,6-dideoxygalactose transaminase
MYVSAWPGLSPATLLRPPRRAGLPFPLEAPRKTYFFRARNALYHLFRALGFSARERVLVPDYHSGNEVAAIRAAGAGLTCYPVTRGLDIDLDALSRRCTPETRAVLAIHFLGWPQRLDALAAFCRQRGLLLVEDCALSLLSEADGVPLGATGDFAVFCLYKTLPVPNGAVLVHNRGLAPGLDALALRRCGLAPLLGRTAELLLEWVRGRCDAPGRALFALKRAAGKRLRAAGVERVPVGDMGFDPRQVDVALSPMCEALLRRWDYEAIRRRRRENFAALRERLLGRVALLKAELPDGACPLFFPILVEDKAAAARALWARGVDAVEFWNEGDPQAPAAPAARFLRDHVLELPLHQDLSTSQVQYVADQVLSIPHLHWSQGGLQ